MGGSGGLGPFTGPGFLNQLSRFNSRPIPGLALPFIRQTNPLAGAYRARGVSQVYDSSAANLIGRVEEWGDLAGPSAVPDIEEGLHVALAYPTIVELWWNMDGIGQTGFPGANCMVGFQLGSHGADPPFAAVQGTPVIQVRFKKQAGFNDISLYVARGDGATASTETRMLLGSGSGVTGLSNQYNGDRRVRLEYYPQQLVRLTTWDRQDLVVKRVQITNPALLPDVGAGWARGMGFYSYTGANAAGNQFSASHGWIHTLREDWGDV